MTRPVLVSGWETVIMVRTAPTPQMDWDAVFCFRMCRLHLEPPSQMKDGEILCPSIHLARLQARILAEDKEAAPKILHDWQPLMCATLKAWYIVSVPPFVTCLLHGTGTGWLSEQSCCLSHKSAFKCVKLQRTQSSCFPFKAWGTDLGDMRRVFEEERNAWMDREEAEWLRLVQPYQNVVSTLKYTEVTSMWRSSCCRRCLLAREQRTWLGVWQTMALCCGQ